MMTGTPRSCCTWTIVPRSKLRPMTSLLTVPGPVVSIVVVGGATLAVTGGDDRHPCRIISSRIFESPQEVAESTSGSQRRGCRSRAQGLEVFHRAGSCQFPRRDLATDPELPQRRPLVHELIVVQRVHGDMGGQVTGPIGHRQHLAPLSETRQGSPNRAGVDSVSIVGCDRKTGSHARDQAFPGDIAALADLDAVPGLQMIHWPERLAPLATRARHHIAEIFIPGRGVDQDLAELAVLVELGNRARNHVRPLVGEYQGAGQALELVRKPRPAGRLKPADGFAELRSGDDVDPEATILGAQPVNLFEKLAASATHVHEGVQVMLVHQRQQSPSQLFADLWHPLSGG